MKLVKIKGTRKIKGFTVVCDAQSEMFCTVDFVSTPYSRNINDPGTSFSSL